MRNSLRRLAACLLALLLAASLPVVALAIEVSGVEVPSAYVYNSRDDGSNVYAFVKSDADLTGASATLVKGGEGYEQNGSVENVAGSDTVVYYYILVDASGSMRGYRDRVRSFVEELISQGSENTLYSIGYFGSDFQTVLEKETDGAKVLEALDSISYDQDWTEPYSALQEAIEAQRHMRVTPDCLMSTIILTDGKPALGSDVSEEEKQSLEDDTTAEIEAAKDIVLHSVCLDTWDDDLQEVLSAGTGLSITSQEGEDAQAAGEVASFRASLYRVGFHKSDVATAGFDIQIRFETSSGDSYRTETVEGIPVENPSLTGEGESTADILSEGGDAAGEGAEEDSPEEGQAGLPLALVLGIAIGVVVVAGAVAIVLLRRRGSRGAVPRSRRQRAGSGRGRRRQSGYDEGRALVPATAERPVSVPMAPTALAPSGISMGITVLAGKPLHAVGAIPLDGDVLLGSDPSCTYAFDDPLMAPRNGRIYPADGIPYVEGLEDEHPIYLNGMRIFAPNVLRNGDVLEVGSTQMRVSLEGPGVTDSETLTGPNH